MVITSSFVYLICYTRASPQLQSSNALQSAHWSLKWSVVALLGKYENINFDEEPGAPFIIIPFEIPILIYAEYFSF